LEAEGQTTPSGSRDEEGEYETGPSNKDIWEDSNCMELLRTRSLSVSIDPTESKRARKRILDYQWQGQSLYFKDRLVPEPKARLALVVQMHSDLGHSGDEALKSIPVCDLFYKIALDTAGPLPETKSGNRYILVAIDHYSKWCKAKAVADHGAKTTARFLEDDVICRYGVPKFVLTDNGGEWAGEFDTMCKDYGIQHQHTAPQWPQCNGMSERLIKTIKHGITVLSTTPDNANCWDEQLVRVMFGYRCGI
jgi:hypothetical protein